MEQVSGHENSNQQETIAAKAAFETAFQLVCGGRISKEEAVSRLTQDQLFAALKKTINPSFKVKPDAIGVGAGGSLVSGIAVFTSEDAVNCTEPCIFVCKEIAPNDFMGIKASVGTLTQFGGITSHEAVMARGFNKACVVGCTSLQISERNGWKATTGTVTMKHGTKLTIDGATGNVWINTEVPVISGEPSEALLAILSWARGKDVSERLTPTFDMSMEEMKTMFSKSTANSIYVDTALLEGNIRVSDGPVTEKMLNLGIAIRGFKGKEIVLDLAGLDKYLDDFDKMLDQMFWDPTGYPESILQAKIVSVIHWSKVVKDKLFVKLPEGITAPAISMLAKSAVKVITKVNTVADLLTANGPVEVTPEIVKLVFGSQEVYERAKKLVENSTGKSLSGGTGKASYWFELLKKGT